MRVPKTSLERMISLLSQSQHNTHAVLGGFKFGNAQPVFQPGRSMSSQEILGGMSNDLLVTLSMNYNNSGSTNDELVDNLKKNGFIKSLRVENALRKTDRALFVQVSEVV